MFIFIFNLRIKMQLVERHVILDKRFEEICYKSGLLYNFITYHCRQAIFGKQEYFQEYEIKERREDYSNLQQIKL
jgi:hypothetical protein